MKHLPSTGYDLDVEAELLKLADESVGGFLGIGTVEVVGARSCHSVPSRKLTPRRVVADRRPASADFSTAPPKKNPLDELFG